MSIRLFRLSVFLISQANAQSFEKVGLSDSGDYFLVLRPAGEIKGALVLIPGFSAPPVAVFPESRLPNVAYANNLLVAALPSPKKLYIDSAVTLRFNKAHTMLIEKYSIPKNKLAIGGFSAGGTLALRYSEMAYEHPKAYPVLPSTVFVIDSPVDLVEIYSYFQREIAKDFSPVGVSEAKSISELLEKEIGTPDKNPKEYSALTPFEERLREPGNERFLKNVAVRTYHDVDVMWGISQHRRSIYDANYLPASELINRLRMLGNERAEFVQSKTKGVLSDGDRHPHSWNIVDEAECVQWIKKSLGIFDPKNYTPEYSLPLPKGWQSEVFSLPPDFAREIPLTGVEELRFPPGWANRASEQYWSYAFLWYLENSATINAETIKESLEKYYNGLVKRNLDANKVPKHKVFPVEVSVTTTKAKPGDVSNFIARIKMPDYMAHKPMALNAQISQRNCKSGKKQALFIQVSPKPFSGEVWKDLNDLWVNFRCSGKR